MTGTFRFDMAVGVVCLVLAFFALRAAFDKDRPRLRWAKKCLILLGVVAVLAGTATGLDASGRAAIVARPSVVHHAAACLRWFTIGLFIPLGFSGQWSGKKPPE